MTLFLKRCKSADGAGFVILDELGCEKYCADFRTNKVSTKYHIVITDACGNTVAKIRKLPFPPADVFALRAGKKHITLVMISAPAGVYSYFYGNNWHINGDIAAKNFTIIDVDKSVILSHTNRNGFCELQIADSANELFCVAASVCVNLINTVDKLAVQAV